MNDLQELIGNPEKEKAYIQAEEEVCEGLMRPLINEASNQIPKYGKPIGDPEKERAGHPKVGKNTTCNINQRGKHYACL